MISLFFYNKFYKFYKYTELNAKIFYSDVDPLTGQMIPDLLVECIKKYKLKK